MILLYKSNLQKGMPVIMDVNEKDSLERILLAGVGAITKTAEAAGEVFEELVKKGTLTVEQGKALNEELKYKVKEKAAETSQKVQSTVVTGFVNNMHKMTPEELSEIRAKIDELDAKKAAGSEDDSNTGNVTED